MRCEERRGWLVRGEWGAGQAVGGEDEVGEGQTSARAWGWTVRPNDIISKLVSWNTLLSHHDYFQRITKFTC
ncbi:hypothetical protein E2C01_090721 [Portunus trituberculatus]|uniref:Uncharacterized protein n=1 Tax=Portunus trituberculatus TaxID=210409 RepID=A0A5B7JLM8_PORTR|nr:hypothetical protein [Portunus trituberculatus]